MKLGIARVGWMGLWGLLFATSSVGCTSELSDTLAAMAPSATETDDSRVDVDDDSEAPTEIDSGTEFTPGSDGTTSSDPVSEPGLDTDEPGTVMEPTVDEPTETDRPSTDETAADDDSVEPPVPSTSDDTEPSSLEDASVPAVDDPDPTVDDSSSDTASDEPTEPTATDVTEVSDVTDTGGTTSDGIETDTVTEVVDSGVEPEPSPEPLNVTLLAPLQDAMDADPATNLVITFGAPISLGAGTIEIVDLDQDRTVETIAVTDARVSLSDDCATIDLDSILLGSNAYAVTLPAGAFEGTGGEEFAGLTWTFQTAAAAIPGGIAADDLIAWYDAAYTQSIKSVSSAVRLWSDRSGHGNNLVQATATNGPTRVAGSLGGNPIVRFDGTDDFMVGPDIVDPSAYDVYIVWRSAVAAGDEFATIFNNGVLETCNLQVTYGHTVAGCEMAAVAAFDGDYVCSAFATPVVDTATLWNVGYDVADGMVTFSNGAQTTVSATSGAVEGATEQLAMGGSDQGEYNFGGDIAEVLLFQRRLESAERDLVETYLADKWGVTLAE